MKSKIFLITYLSFLLTFLCSCEKEINFTKEQYKKVIYALSHDSDGVFPYVHSLNTEESVGYITVYAGGTNPIDKDVTVKFSEDDSLFNAYNKSHYDIDTTKFAKLLPKEHYSIPSYTIILKKESADPYSLMPIYVKPEGLSPDSVYFINLKISDVSNYEINPNKRSVLYKVEIENNYASTINQSIYMMSGTQVVEGKTDTTRISFGVNMFPLTKNKVRIVAGANSLGNNNLNTINNYSLVLRINENNSVDIFPYKTIEVDKMGATSNYFTYEEYSNIVYKVFYLHYKYRVLQPNGVYGQWMIVNQRLTMQSSDNSIR